MLFFFISESDGHFLIVALLLLLNSTFLLVIKGVSRKKQTKQNYFLLGMESISDPLL